MKRILPLFILFLFPSCKTVIVSSQYNHGTAMDEYFSFNWLPGISESFQSSNLDTPVLQNIQNQLMREMILKGFAYNKEKPEVLVNVEAITDAKRDLDNVRKLGYSYWGDYDSTRKFKPGDLVVEIVDAESETVIWQGTAQNALSGNLGKEEALSKVVKEIFGTLGN